MKLASSKVTSLGGLAELLFESREVVVPATAKFFSIPDSVVEASVPNLDTPIDVVGAYLETLVYAFNNNHSPHRLRALHPSIVDVLPAASFLKFHDGNNKEWMGHSGFQRQRITLDYEWRIETIQKYFYPLRELWREIEFAYRPDGKEIPDGIRIFLSNENLEGLCIRPSVEDPSMWVYTPNAEYGLADRQVRMKPGKLLKKLLPNLDDTVVQQMATWYVQGVARAFELLFAKTREEIRDVYENGPSSCMSGADWDDIHPAEAYASGEVWVAYTRDPLDERIVARSVYNVEHNQYGRLYGNQEALQRLLEKHGATHNYEALDGCKLLKLEDRRGRLMLPYVDGFSGVVDRGSFFRLDSGSDCDYTCSSDGYAHARNATCCDECGEETDEDDLTWVEFVERSVCPHCLENNYVAAIVSARSRHRYDTEYVRSRDATWYDCVEEYVFDRGASEILDAMEFVYSEYHGDWYSTDDVEYLDSKDDWFLPTEIVKLHDGSRDLKEDCVLTYNREYALREDCVELSDDSREAGEWALEVECSKNAAGNWVLDDEIESESETETVAEAA
jgi:hypothetical protein